MKISLLLTLMMLFVFALPARSQIKKTSSSWKSPTFTIDIAPNYSLPMHEAKGDNIGEFFSFKNYGTKIGWGTSFNFKFCVGPYGQYRPYVSLGYTQMQASDDNTAYIGDNIIKGGYPYRDDSIPTPASGNSEMFLRIPYIAAGFEYAFTNIDRKKRMWYPHIGVEMLLSVITGTYRQTSPDAPPDNAPGAETGFTIKTDVRIGIGAGLGATVRFGKRMGITFGGKYKLFNLIGKKSDFLMEENKMNLLDKSAADLNSNLSKDRSIGSIELYLGATIFLGKTKK
jgi:hypothetical protein